MFINRCARAFFNCLYQSLQQCGLQNKRTGKNKETQNTVQKPSLSDDGQDLTFLRQQTRQQFERENRKDHFFPFFAHLKVGRTVWKMVKEDKTDQVAILRRSHTHMVLGHHDDYKHRQHLCAQTNVGLRGNVRNFPSTN